MDYLDRLHKELIKEKIHEKFIKGDMSTSEMEAKVRKIGKKLKQKKKC